MIEDMNEDRALTAAVKSALEEGVAPEAGRIRALLEAAGREARLRRARGLLWRWGVPALLAASFALALAIEATFSDGVSHGAAKDGVTEAICLLCELDGTADDGLSAVSPGERLLAWQEAPCADLL